MASRKRHLGWTADQVVRALQADARRRGRPPRASEWARSAGRRHPTAGVVRQLFAGQWDLALTAAGLEPQGHGRWNPSAILRALQADARRRGRPPTTNEWTRTGGPRRPTFATVQRVFGSWSAGLAAAGLQGQKLGGDRWTHCKRGHPLEGDNVGVYSSGTRFCRACRRAWDRERKRRLYAERREAV